VINFISNLPHDLRSGGFSALNAASLTALRRTHAVHYAGPINPPVIGWQKAVSKLRRATGSHGEFAFFSNRRLETIARQVDARCQAEASLDCFHGFTPWVLTRPQRPYVAWSDCTFRDYIEIFQSRRMFRRADLDRIENAEAAWLNNAHRVLFTSNWAANRAVSDYGLDRSRVSSLGIFGEIETLPTVDAYSGAKEFAFISTDFEAKGGGIVLGALQVVKQRHPDASLIVVGDRPARRATEPGVTFAGYLRKESSEECATYQQILGRVRAVVNATRSDIAPLLFVEAGYFGCPVISSRQFAIPELVADGQTGVLLDDSSQVEAVAGAMNWMLDEEHAYRRMREAAWAKARHEHSRRRFEDRLLACVSDLVVA
jgi:glycosyltransferase involved in cell wall biosynthesis